MLPVDEEEGMTPDEFFCPPGFGIEYLDRIHSGSSKSLSRINSWKRSFSCPPPTKTWKSPSCCCCCADSSESPFSRGVGGVRLSFEVRVLEVLPTKNRSTKERRRSKDIFRFLGEGNHSEVKKERRDKKRESNP